MRPDGTLQCRMRRETVELPQVDGIEKPLMQLAGSVINNGLMLKCHDLEAILKGSGESFEAPPR